MNEEEKLWDLVREELYGKSNGDKNKKEILGYYFMGKQKINAIIGKNNVIGCQFLPEKSGKNGSSCRKACSKKKLFFL